MDADLVRSLGSISVPMDDFSSPLGNSFVVTNVGDLFALKGDGQIVYTSLRNEKTALQNLPVELSSSKIDFSTLRHIAVNKDGSLLALWSTQLVAVVEIPLNWMRHGNVSEPLDASSGSIPSRPIMRIVSQEMGTSNKFIKVAFHPLCDHSLVILRERETMSFIDMRDSSLLQDILLPSKLNFVSFTFGPNVEWLRYTIFLATSENEIFFLCPIIPPNTPISNRNKREIWTWYDQHKNLIEKNSSNNSSERKLKDKTYFEITKLFLEQTVGFDEPNETLLSDSNLLVLTKELQKVSIHSRVNDMDWQNIAISNVALQGPLPIFKGQSACADSSTTIDRLCDLSTPISKALGPAPPVIVVAYGSGQVDLLLLDAQGDTMNLIYPGWKKIDGTYTIGKTSVCLVADTFNVGKPSSFISNWKLVPDPGFTHQMFCVNTVTSESYLLSSAWLSRALQTVHCAMEGIEGSDLEENDPSSSHSLCLPLLDGSNYSRKISGMQCFQDPFAGHILLLRLQIGEFYAINMTMHAKLCSMQLKKKSLTISSSATDKLKTEFQAMMSDESMKWRQTSRLIEKIACGLNELPKLEVAVDGNTNEVEVHGDIHRNKILTEAAQKLEQNVLVHIMDLHEVTTVHMKMVEEIYGVQRELVEGVEKPSLSEGSTLSLGLQRLILHLTNENRALVKRLIALENRYNYQREKVDSMLRVIYAVRNKKLTPTEKVYHHQLQQFIEKAAIMERDINILRKNLVPKILGCTLEPTLSRNASLHQQPSVVKKSNNAFSPSMSTFQRSSIPSTPGVPISPSKVLPSPNDPSVINISDASLSWSASKFNASQTPTKLGMGSPYAKFTPKTVGKQPKQLPQLPTVELSEEEEKVCLDLLGKQSEMIAESKKKVQDLERKLAAAKGLAPIK